MPVVTALPPAPPATDNVPRQAVTQEEANAIAANLDMSEVDHVQVSWVDGHKGRQALLWPIKSKWVGYIMVVALLLTSRVSKTALDPTMPWEFGRRPRHAAAMVVAR